MACCRSRKYDHQPSLRFSIREVVVIFQKGKLHAGGDHVLARWKIDQLFGLCPLMIPY